MAEKSPSNQQFRQGMIAAALIIIVVGGALGAGIAGGVTTSIPKFGTWNNFPSSTTELDRNELFFNKTYRVVADFPTGSQQVSVELVVSCVKPSNTIGANLQLQSATYNPATGLNSTNFTDVGFIADFIDNSFGFPCPGIGVSLPFSTPNPPNYVIYRVLGIGGGGTGDNPRLESVSIILFTLRRPLIQIFQTATTTNIDFSFQTTEFFSGTFTIVFDWIAKGTTSEQSGTNTCSGGTSVNGCTVVVTFGVAFLTVPIITTSLSSQSGIPNVLIPIGSYSLFQTFLN